MMNQAFHLTKVHSSGVKVLEDAYFSLPSGSFAAILGESRTGKSTFLKMLGGEEKPTSGVLKVYHLDIYSLSFKEKHIWLSDVGMIFPDLHLFPDKTIEENIAFILQVKGASGEGEREAITKLLSRAGLADKAGAKPSVLSSGEQRVVLALRALIFWPKLLLADDPFQGMDEKAATVLFRFFLELQKSGSTIVLTTQQMPFVGEVQRLASDAPLLWYRLENGKLQALEEWAP